jgi:uncharacterized protein (DUF433 family)
VHFADGPAGRRAMLIGTGMDVWEVIGVVRDNEGAVAEASAYLELPTHLIQDAVDYYAAYRDEIDELTAVNEAEAQAAHARWTAGQHAFDR